MAHLAKAVGFNDQRNWVQTLRYAELAATKLKQLKDRRLETVQAISDALGCKFNALQRLDRHREALECIMECYTLWAMNHLRNPGSMRAALGLIQSCLHNEEYEDAEQLYPGRPTTGVPCRGIILSCCSYISFGAVWRYSTGKQAESRGGSNFSFTHGVGNAYSAAWN